MSKYSRIRRASTTRLPDSIDFSDQSFSFKKHNSSSEHTSSSENPIQEDARRVTDDEGEVFGEILGRKFPTSNSAASCKFMAEKKNINLQRSVKKSFSMRRRSISFSEGYSRIHDQHDISVEDENGDAPDTLPARPSKKKGHIFTTWKRFFRF